MRTMFLVAPAANQRFVYDQFSRDAAHLITLGFFSGGGFIVLVPCLSSGFSCLTSVLGSVFTCSSAKTNGQEQRVVMTMIKKHHFSKS